jgi:glutaredoxin 3
MQSAKERVEAMIAEPGKVLVFSKTWCPFCDEAENILLKADIEFDTIELDKIPDGE